MRSAVRALLQLERTGFAAGYATKAPEDYSLVMKKAAEVSSGVASAPKGEVGSCAGVPLDELAKRTVCTNFQTLSLSTAFGNGNHRHR